MSSGVKLTLPSLLLCLKVREKLCNLLKVPGTGINQDSGPPRCNFVPRHHILSFPYFIFEDLGLESRAWLLLGQPCSINLQPSPFLRIVPGIQKLHALLRYNQQMAAKERPSEAMGLFLAQAGCSLLAGFFPGEEPRNSAGGVRFSGPVLI